MDLNYITTKVELIYIFCYAYWQCCPYFSYLDPSHEQYDCIMTKAKFMSFTTHTSGVAPILFFYLDPPLEQHVDPSCITTKAELISFATPTGGVAPILSYLDPSLSSGTQPTGESNCIIAENRHFPPLDDQINNGLKALINSVSTRFGSTSQGFFTLPLLSMQQS